MFLVRFLSVTYGGLYFLDKRGIITTHREEAKKFEHKYQAISFLHKIKKRSSRLNIGSAHYLSNEIQESDIITDELLDVEELMCM